MSDPENKKQVNTSLPEQLPSMDEVFLDRLKKAIEENLEDKDFGVDELGREVGMSRSQIHRKLKDTVGQSASRFIRSYKLEKAKELLERKVGRVAEISDQLGFSSPVYFSQVFTEEFGYPPSAVEERKEASSEPQPHVGIRHWKLFLSVTILIFVIGGVFWLQNRSSSHPPREPLDKSIAVLPFQNLSADPENEYFSDGITEDIIGQLAKISDLKVMSRTSIMLYKHTEKKLIQIAEELGVATILEGSVRRSGDQVRIVAQLIDTQTDTHLWSETFDREMTEVFAVQSEVAQQIAAKMQAKVKPEETERLNKYTSTDPQAYDLFLKGRALEYTYMRENLYKAIDLYQRVLNIDPSFAEAYARIGGCYVALGSWIGDLSIQIASDSADLYLGKAMLLNPELATAHASEAYNQFTFKKNFSLAEERFLLAYQLDPSDIINISSYQHFLNCMGRFEESLEWWEKGNQVAPFSNWNYGYKGTALFLLSQEDEAVDFYRHALNFIPYHPVLYNKMGWILYNTGKYEEAIQILEEGMEKFGFRHPSMVSYLALAYYQTGDIDRSNRLVEELKQRFDNNEKETAPFLGVYYSGIQQKEAALQWLERSYERNDVELIWLKTEPPLRFLHGDPRYEQLLRKVGFD